MSVITNKWNDGSGDSINIESPSFQGNQTVKISSPVQKGTSKRSMKFIGKCKKDSSKQVILTVEQEASTYTYDLTLNSDNTEIAAKGGTAIITAVLKMYRNGNLVSTDNVTPVLSGSATGFSISGTTVTASNRTTTVGDRRGIVVTGKYSNTFDGQTVLSTINIYQEANNKTVKEITNRYVSSNPFTGQNTVKANGGTVKVNTFAIYNYTSGSTSETDVSSECTFTNPQFGTWNSNTHVWTCPSAGTTVYEDNRGTSITVKWNDKTTHYYLYQEANSQTLREITNRYTSSNPLTGQNTVKANGGTVWVYTFAIYDYTSGDSSETNVSDECTFGNVTFGTWDSAKHTWICPSAGTTIYSNDRSASIKVTWGSKKTTYYLYQEKNLESVKSISGGIYTYGNIVAGTISNKTIPASGGSATATAGNGSQTWNKSATITTYEYTSGATKDVTTEAASNGTANVVPNVSSITATASSKGTTVSAQTTVKSQAVTWSANGKSASGTMYIYQAANSIDSYNYGSWNIVISANPTTIAASGGTSIITASCTRTKTPVYTSGSTGTVATESVTPMLAISGTGFTLSGTTVTASKNNVAARIATVTASYSGATSKSVTITQSAGPDGIGYMQIEGNGVDHYIFQVGRTPNTRSNDVQTLSEEPVEVAVETKSESLFAKIKRIVTNLN